MAKRSRKSKPNKWKAAPQARTSRQVAISPLDPGSAAIAAAKRSVARAKRRKPKVKSGGTRKLPKIRSRTKPKTSPRKPRKIVTRPPANRRKRPQRAMMLFSDGKAIQVKIGRKAASRIGEYLNAVDEFLRTNDPDHLRRFVGLAIRDRGGKSHILETRPNSLYRLNAGIEPFEEVYRILT